uniref:Uncharacterized protein n=1 Tax=Acrobeloides nanus TaxID=290746 RepID=A0A914EQK1_9BILA
MLTAILVIVVGILCIILVIHFGGYHKNYTAVPPKPLSVNANYERFSEYLIDSVNGDNIASNLRIITKEPHVAGTKAN